jgi:shikimate kinase
MNTLNIRKNTALIGMPGCGKTTIGKELSKIFNLPFYDVDNYIEGKERRTIKEIFEQYGEEYFREVETKALREIVNSGLSIISTGGGIVKKPENIKILEDNSIIIFVNRPVENIIQDIDIDSRPLLEGDSSKILKLYNERFHLYKKYCHHEILNDKGINEAIEGIINIIKK